MAIQLIFLFGDTIIASEIAFPELTSVSGGEPECRFTIVPFVDRTEGSFPWVYHRHQAGGAIWLSLGRRGGEYLLHYPGLAEFYLFSQCADIRCVPVQGTTMDTSRHLFLDQVLPLVLSHRGRLVLHASAVDLREGIVAFAGETGLGKSTLAASFSRQGSLVVTDDCLVIKEGEGWLVGYPSYPSLRLWETSLAALYPEGSPPATVVAGYTAKMSVVVGGNGALLSNTPRPLRRVYFLGEWEGGCDEQNVLIRPLSRREAFRALLTGAFRLEVTSKELLRREFELFGRLAGRPLFFSISYPRMYAWLPRVREAIENQLLEGPKDTEPRNPKRL